MRGILREVRRTYDPDTLDSLILFVTAACNFRCDFCCYADNLNQGGDISLEQMEKIARSCGPLRSLRISGGEPFLRKTLPQILLAFRKYCHVKAINIPTNGWYTDKTLDQVRTFLDADREATLTISFSIDGVGEVHDEGRGYEGAYVRALETLAAVGSLKDTYPNLRIQISSVLTEVNGESIDGLIDLIRSDYPAVDEHGISIIRDIHLADADYASKRGLTDQFERLMKKSYAPRSNTPRTRRPGQLAPLLNRLVVPGVHRTLTRVTVDRVHGKLWPYPCVAGRATIVIDSRGALSPCELRIEKIALADHDFDVQAAMSSPPFQAALERIMKERCDCTHGCFIGDSLLHSGTYFARAVAARTFF